MKKANSTKQALNGTASSRNRAKFKRKPYAMRSNSAILRKRKSSDEEQSISGMRRKSGLLSLSPTTKRTRASLGSKSSVGKVSFPPTEVDSSTTPTSDDSETSDSDDEQVTVKKSSPAKQANNSTIKKTDKRGQASREMNKIDALKKVQARSTRSSVSDTTVVKRSNSTDRNELAKSKNNSVNNKKKVSVQVLSGADGEGTSLDFLSSNEAKKKDTATGQEASKSCNNATSANSKFPGKFKSPAAVESSPPVESTSKSSSDVAATVGVKAVIKTPLQSASAIKVTTVDTGASKKLSVVSQNGTSNIASTVVHKSTASMSHQKLAATVAAPVTGHSALAVNIGNQLNGIIRNIVNKHEHQLKQKDEEIRRLRQELNLKTDQLQQYHEVLQRNSVLESIHSQWNKPLMRLESSNNSSPAVDACTSNAPSCIVIQPENVASSDQVSSDHHYTRFSRESSVTNIANASAESELPISSNSGVVEEAGATASNSNDNKDSEMAEESDCKITSVVRKKRKRVSERLQQQGTKVKVKKKRESEEEKGEDDDEEDDAKGKDSGKDAGDKDKEDGKSGDSNSDKDGESGDNNGDNSGNSGRNNSNNDQSAANKAMPALSSEELRRQQQQRMMEAEQHMRGRHRIRKLIDGRKLCHETKAAQKAEKERRERVLKERENHVLEKHTDPQTKEVTYTKCVLSKPQDKLPQVEISSKLLKKLKAHQVEAVEFLWDNVIESVKNPLNSGCILAHCMGLGKTLTVITFIKTLFDCPSLGVKRCLVICPLNTTLNWEQEFEKWLTKKERPKVYQLASLKGDNKERCSLLTDWHRDGGVAIIGYQLFRILTSYRGRSNKIKATVLTCLLDPGPDIVVCDEGHLLKNSGSQLAKCVNKIYTKRRVVLTGTPLQNNLIEYHCMVQFVKPQLLGTRHEFLNRFVNPITNGQHADSTPADVKLMKQRVHILHESLAGCVQRRDYSTIVQFLPPRREFVVLVRLSANQVKLYDKYLKDYVRLPPTLGSKDKIKSKEKVKGTENDKEKNDGNDESNDEDESSVGQKLFADYQTLMLVWQHPWLLKMHSARAKKQAVEGDTDESWFEDSSSDEGEESSSGKDDAGKSNGKASAARATRSARREESKKQAAAAEAATAAVVKSKCTIAGEVIRQWRSSRRHGSQAMDLSLADEAEDDTEKHWYSDLVTDVDHWSEEVSGKMALLFDIVRLAEQLGDKVLVFSQSVLTLDLIEDFLQHKTEEAKRIGSRKSKGVKRAAATVWEAGLDYHRIDGTTAAHHRQEYMTDFCDPTNNRLRLFLISTRAGGLGVNLEAANRVVLFDASWNPAHDIQSIFRAYRFGQTKPVYIYRLLAQGTMEEKIYERQVMKQTLSLRVVDEHQVDRHFSAADIAELYKFTPEREDDPSKPLPAVPQDVLLADLMSQAKSKKWIATYHEHDSLLENRPDEELTIEERRAAWDEYERERDGIFTAAAALQFVRPMMMGMNPNANVFADRRPMIIGGRQDDEPRFVLVEGQPVAVGSTGRFMYNSGNIRTGITPNAYGVMSNGSASAGVARPRPNNYWLSGLKWPKGRVFANGWLQVAGRNKGGANGEQEQNGDDDEIVDITPPQDSSSQSLANPRPGLVMQNGLGRTQTYRQRLKLVQQNERPPPSALTTQSQSLPMPSVPAPAGGSGQGQAAAAAANESIPQSRSVSSPSPLLVSQLCKQLNTQFSNGDMREVQEVYLTRIVSEIMKYNPSITTEDLAARVRAFFVVHGWQQHRQLARTLPANAVSAPTPSPTPPPPPPSSTSN